VVILVYYRQPGTTYSTSGLRWSFRVLSFWRRFWSLAQWQIWQQSRLWCPSCAQSISSTVVVCLSHANPSRAGPAMEVPSTDIDVISLHFTSRSRYDIARRRSLSTCTSDNQTDRRRRRGAHSTVNLVARSKNVRNGCHQIIQTCTASSTPQVHVSQVLYMSS